MDNLPKITNKKPLRNTFRTKTQQISRQKDRITQLYKSLLKQKLVHRPSQNLFSSYLNICPQSRNNSETSSVSSSTCKLESRKLVNNQVTVLESNKQSKMSKILQKLNQKFQVGHPERGNISRVTIISRKASKVSQRKINESKVRINQQKYQRIIAAYYQFEQNMTNHKLSVQPSTQIEHQAINQQEQKILTSFLRQIKIVNKFFGKLSDTVGLAFLKVGKVRFCEENKYLYKENDRAMSFYVVLWGKVKLKHTHNNVVHYCITGDHLGQQTVIQRTLQMKKKMLLSSRLIKGIRPRMQSARAMSKCGFLEIPSQHYKTIKQQLTILGFKQQVNLAQKMISWSFRKKTNFRNS